MDLLRSQGGEEIDLPLYLLRIQRRHRHLAPVINNAPKVRLNAGEVIARSLRISMFLDGLDDVEEGFCCHIVTTPKLTVDVGQQLKFYRLQSSSRVIDEFEFILIDMIPRQKNDELLVVDTTPQHSECSNQLILKTYSFIHFLHAELVESSQKLFSVNDFFSHFPADWAATFLLFVFLHLRPDRRNC